ncbi:MAG: hypothetical protein QM820_12990 [Minicystis sp.]
MKLFSARFVSVFLALAGSTYGVACGTSNPPTSTDPASFTLTTDTFEVAPGDERYLCYATTLTEDLAVDKFDYTALPGVHHMLLARTLTPEPEGLSECNVLIRTSWVPLFGAGKGDVSLEAPKDAGYVLPKGTQLLVQLHLLNTSPTKISEKTSITMRKAATASPSPVSIYAFGTNVISIDPHQTAQVTNDCTTEKDVEIFAWWPHMHKLGTSLTLEVGPSPDNMKEVYRLDPWNFDDQHMQPVPLHIDKGSYTRVTCSYDNPKDEAVTFGESSNDEMCYLVTFVTGNNGEIDGCVNQSSPPGDGGVPPNPDAGACGDQVPNAAGIGAPCTKGGGECASGLTCSADQGDDPPGFCLKIGGCTTTPDCGGGSATCCAPKEAGGLLNICIPEACRPADCLPK